MTENTSTADQSNGYLYLRAFELLPGAEYVVFFAASDTELPGEDVRRELRVLALHDRQIETRSTTGIVATDIISGVIGGAAWDAMKATYTALASYLRRKHGTPAVDAAAIAQRLTAASEEILGPGPAPLDKLKLKQLKDLRWEAEFTSHGIDVKATIDPAGTVVKWNQN